MNSYIFRAYDVRGIFNEDLTPETMTTIGAALGTYIQDNPDIDPSVVVGNDIRTSSIALSSALISGLLSTGVDVTAVGTTSFGVCVFSGWKLSKGIIAYITASHLPPEWNGVKFYTGEGIGFSREMNAEIEKIVRENRIKRVKWEKTGKLTHINIKNDYISYLSQCFHIERPIKVVLDCGNGSMGLIAPDVFRELGMKTIVLFSNIDPSFPNRPSEPTKENIGILAKHVKRSGADFGIAFDGDGDRGLVVDDRGRPLTPEQVGIIIGKGLLSKKKGTIIANVECSMAIERELEKYGGKISRIPVGHTFLTSEAKKQNALLGIESSGHFVIPEYFLFDDAMVVGLKLAEILSKSEKTLSEMADEIPIYPKERVDISCSDALKFDVMQSLKNRLLEEYDRVNTLDGIRIDLDEGWGLIRASNTSPMIRVTVEGSSQPDLEKLKNCFSKKTKEAIESL
ncbi:MAG: hypothetical protein ACXQT5_04670 [Candidatus Syntropharchaeia archaeon]